MVNATVQLIRCKSLNRVFRGPFQAARVLISEGSVKGARSQYANSILNVARGLPLHPLGLTVR